MVAVALSAENQTFGILAALKADPGQGFTDFGVTRLAAFAEFASLTIDNFLKYNELIETREARYLALQSQVQPHFINNVLGSFFGLNRKGDSAGLEQAIIALREMLRYVQEGKPWVSLGEEFGFLERYCELQQIRFGDKFSYVFDCDEASRYVRVPRLLLQPLVENALVHGIQPSAEAGRLEIRCRAVRLRGETSAEIEIIDDGVGFDSSALDERQQIGISNVRQRLDIADPNHIFTIESRPGEGTRVYIRL